MTQIRNKNMQQIQSTAFGNLKSVFASCLAAVSLFASLDQSPANELARDYVETRTQQLKSIAEELEVEIKNHLKRSDGYRKMLGVNSQIIRKAATVNRQVDRESENRRLDDNVDKIQELTWELSSLYNESLNTIDRDEKRDERTGNTNHVASRIVVMRKLADSIKAASDYGLVPVVAVQPIAVRPVRSAVPVAPQPSPRFEVAPQIRPELVGPQSNLRNIPAQVSAPQIQPVLTAPKPVMNETTKVSETSNHQKPVVSKPAPTEQTETIMHSVLEQ